MKRNPIDSDGRAFTLLELLVVMSIIAILATAGLTGYGVTMEAARRAQAHTDCLGLENSFSQYLTLEGPFPGQWDGPQSTRGAFLSAIMGEKSERNRSGTPYFQPARVKSNPKAHGYIVTLNQYNDPWGNPYRVLLDVANEGTVSVPAAYRKRFGHQLRGLSIFVYSAGRDGRLNTVEDNVTSLD